MKKIAYSLLFVSSIALGQVEKEVGNFNKIKILDRMEVVLAHSDKNSIVIEGVVEDEENEEVKVVELLTKNGVLQVKRTPEKVESGEDISITINYKNIDEIIAENGAVIRNDNYIQLPALNIIARESSEIILMLTVDKLTCKLESSSTVTLEGTVKKQDVTVNSGGIFNANDFVAEETIITSNSGDANINTTNFVIANACYDGNIIIHGNPIQINQNRFSGGTVREED